MQCINSETKAIIIEKLDKLNISGNGVQILAEFIEQLHECSFEEGKKGKKSMRPLTKYNIFLSLCLKGTNNSPKKSMSDCIPIWRIIKECIKNGGNLDSCKSNVGY